MSDTWIACFEMVLIDTWWNVNEATEAAEKNDTDSFNRYMVECEFVCAIASQTSFCVLIDTWWNVNFTHADCLFI